MKNLKKQSGYALLILMLILTLAAATLAVKTMSNNGNSQIARDKITAAALAQAKEALIGYAITYGDSHPGEVHGYLPCPDTSGTAVGGEGAAEGNCGAKNISAIGKFPWKTLDMPPLRAGDNECLWYAVSGTYKYNTKTDLMNWDTNGQLQVYDSDGTTLLTPADNQAVAVIFAPGEALEQSRPVASGTSSCGGNYIASNYLDNDTEHHINNSDIATGKFIQPHKDRDANGKIILTVNDQMLFITKHDIWNAMQKRSDFTNTLKLLTQRITECIADYGKHNDVLLASDPNKNKSLPWPSPLALPTQNYSVNINYNDSSDQYSGRVSYRVNNSKSDSNNLMSGTYLIANNGLSCPYYAAIPASELQRLYPWWDNWKDHFFYALSREYRPKNNKTSNCGSCVTINNTGNYAAVVMFAGNRITGQTRASSVTDAQRGIASNYLEEGNASGVAATPTSAHPSSGNENYQTISTSNSPFNDIVYCIKEDLSVPPTGCP